VPRSTSGGDDPKGGDGEQGRRRRKTKARPGNPNADPVKIHREYVERHLGGGSEASAETYANARAQWRRLPGAVTEISGVDAPDDLEGDDGGAA
jgi:hypothetical protein